ncbi:MAG: helix-turn-helix domain-containing protein [Paraburkholderia sp.]|jgi:AcrR family transcriptional regulator|uniref:TetR/AcrR family transcriptional regulator n=1 Tax=Burkholderiaceae TaxID=119060 RepID=UPI0010F468B3|nr:TetR/AcrR family transcriptional regulator [Burkholderia sp. 4M9327F10]
MPTTLATGAHEPKRQRGHLRVAAIMEAGVAVFTEKGYDAATMTEIAARSGTAIGSLYRFFPSKEVLADALLLNYAQHVTDRFAALAARAPAMTLEVLADALVDFMVSQQSQRSFAGTLLDARGGSDERRVKFRQAMRNGLAGVLRTVIPGMAKAKSETMAVVLLHVLKGVAVVADEKPAARRLLHAEIRHLVRVYLLAAQAEADA